MQNGYPENKAHKGIVFPSPIFGPIHSRRLGVSLGINLMPADGKVCTFDCIYCECGFNKDHRPHLPRPYAQIPQPPGLIALIHKTVPYVYVQRRSC